MSTDVETKEVTKTPTEMELLMARIATLERIVTLMEGIVVANATGVTTKGKQRFGGSHEAKPVLDTLTGIEYKSLSACGAAVAPTLGIPVTNTCWYAVKAACPGRFVIG